MTIAESIKEMEQHLADCRRIDVEMMIWKERYRLADESLKRSMMVEMLERIGLDESCLIK